jgi:hypothetical protein
VPSGPTAMLDIGVVLPSVDRSGETA